ncbi:MAG: hypothetical protein ABFS32_13880 [Bacteroidota bacterium]
MKNRWRKAFAYLLDTQTIAYFLALCIVTFLVLFAKKSLVENETVAFQILQEEGRFGPFQILNTLQFLGIPIIYAYKVTVIAFVLWTGAFMFGYRITYKQMWHIALVSETVFLLAEFVKIMWFILIDHQPELPEIIAFYPLSLMNLVDPDMLAKNWHYPFKALNLFEILYWIVLIEAIHLTAGKKWNYAFAIVITTYVPVFLIWLVYYTQVYK